MFLRAKHTLYLSFPQSSQTCIFSCHTTELGNYHRSGFLFLTTNRNGTNWKPVTFVGPSEGWNLEVQINSERDSQDQPTWVGTRIHSWRVRVSCESPLYLYLTFKNLVKLLHRYEKSQTVGVTTSERGTFKISTVFSAYPINYTLKEKKSFQSPFLHWRKDSQSDVIASSSFLASREEEDEKWGSRGTSQSWTLLGITMLRLRDAKSWDMGTRAQNFPSQYLTTTSMGPQIMAIYHN